MGFRSLSEMLNIASWVQDSILELPDMGSVSMM